MSAQWRAGALGNPDLCDKPLSIVCDASESLPEIPASVPAYILLLNRRLESVLSSFINGPVWSVSDLFCPQTLTSHATSWPPTLRSLAETPPWPLTMCSKGFSKHPLWSPVRATRKSRNQRTKNSQIPPLERDVGRRELTVCHCVQEAHFSLRPTAWATRKEKLTWTRDLG